MHASLRRRAEASSGVGSRTTRRVLIWEAPLQITLQDECASLQLQLAERVWPVTSLDLDLIIHKHVEEDRKIVACAF